VINLIKFGNYPYNPNMGQKIQSQARGMLGDAASLFHINIPMAYAVVADTDAVKIGIVTSIAETVVLEGFTKLNIARNITATTRGTAGDVKAVQIVVEGLNMNNEAITETLPAFTIDTLGTVTGAKAFKEVTKVTIPAMDGAGVLVDIGFGEVIGLPFKLSHNTLLKTYRANVEEVTAPTVQKDSAKLEGNTMKLNAALNGTDIDAYFIV